MDRSSLFDDMQLTIGGNTFTTTNGRTVWPGSRLFFLSRYLPPPGILYQYVNVRERVKQNGIEEVLPNYTQYHFEVFNPEMIDYRLLPVKDEGTMRLGSIKDLVKGIFETVIDIAYDWDDLDYRSRILTRRVNFKDYTARIGNLKSHYSVWRRWQTRA